MLYAPGRKNYTATVAFTTGIPNYYGDLRLTGAYIEAVTRHAERMAEQIIGAQKKNIKFTIVQAI